MEMHPIKNLHGNNDRHQMGIHPRGFQHCSMLQLEFYEVFFVTSIQLFHPTFTCLSTRPSFQVKNNLFWASYRWQDSKSTHNSRNVAWNVAWNGVW